MEIENPLEAVCHVGDAALHRLDSLGLTSEDIFEPLGRAAAEARLSTELDAPGMPGYTFWSRSNRFFREGMRPKRWTHSNSQQILRCIHPSGKFAVTASSGSGLVGEEHGNSPGAVRSKNPKGAAVAKLVQTNAEQLALFSLPKPRKAAEITDIPTWFLLYKSSREGLVFELSLPVDMRGQYVDTWRERIILPQNPFRGPDFEIKWLDEISEEVTVDVPVEFKGAI